MERPIVFVDRRAKPDRRQEKDPCKDIPVDLYHRMRRKSVDRRTPNKSLVQDYIDFLESHSKKRAAEEHEASLN